MVAVLEVEQGLAIQQGYMFCCHGHVKKMKMMNQQIAHSDDHLYQIPKLDKLSLLSMLRLARESWMSVCLSFRRTLVPWRHWPMTVSTCRVSD